MTNTLATLVIYAYSSFTSPWGVGPTIVKNFEKKCSCHVELVDAGDAGAMINRLKLEGEDTRADAVVGIDENFLWRLEKDLHWKTQARSFDQAPLAFVYDSAAVTGPPTSLEDLLHERFKGKIIIEDPRLSTTGLGFLLWVIKEKGEKKAWDYLRLLKPQLKLIAPSWDLAYGLFKKSPTDIVFSYVTSPAYHIQEDKKENIQAAIFKKGHYVQTEYFAINPKSKNKTLAWKWGEHLLSLESQGLMSEKNFMYPVNTKAKLSPAFKKLKKPKELLPVDEKILEKKFSSWLSSWQEIFNQ